MALSTGTRLGPYEVTGSLGAGGMGEVYRARDPRLGRDVAIKVLPAALSADADRLQRFEQEARAAAALNHPNILAVHDIGTRDGAPYIVSELLEGETLRERTSDGPVPVRKAVEFAVHIARGLAAAHEKGIVHRDLKPENIFITQDGRVKILDFGLAKLTHEEATAAGASGLPTTPPHTVPGVVLGTAGYMSPEQVRGSAANHRSDIFALGAVLYELLSGRRAFAGDTAIDAMTAILKEDPPDLPAAERHIPPALERIVDRCLEKSPGSRFQSADDLAFALEALSTQSGAAEAVLDRAAPRWRERLAWIVAAFLAVAFAAAVTVPFVRTPPAAPETRLEITTAATADPASLAISPDGTRVVFAASGDGQPRLWLRSLSATTAQPLDGTEGATYPFWSPDGRSLGFFDGTRLKRLDIGVGQPRTLASAAPRGGAWNADGVILFTRSATGPLFRISASSPAEAVAATNVETFGHATHRYPQFLPDGRRFLFYAQGAAQTRGVYLGSLDAPEIKRLTAADSNGVYLPPAGSSREEGWLLFVQQGTLVGRHLDLSRGELTGDPVTVADSVSFDGSLNVAALSVSASGLITFRTGGIGRRQLTWFDRTGKVLGTLGEPDDQGLSSPRISPNGRRVAVFRAEQGDNDIWLLDGVRRTRFTFDPSLDRYPIWSVDGSEIIFDSNRSGRRNFYRKQSNNTGSEQVLLVSDADKVTHDRSPDGHFLLYQQSHPKTRWDIWALPLTGDPNPFAFLNTNFDERSSQFSPDGRWVAYASDESGGRYEIYVRSFPKNDTQVSIISSAGGIWPRWRLPDGKELYYIAPDGKLMGAPITVKGATLEPGVPVALFPTRILGGGTNIDIGRQYDVAPDGRILINAIADEATASPIVVIQNWAAARR